MTEAEEEYELYDNSEEAYEDYDAQIAMGLVDPPDAEVSRRIFSSYLVSPFDTRRSTTPNIRLPTKSNIRLRLAG
jgi:hypothetical protein